MGVVIHLPERASRPLLRPREGETATILFFTGVRYERDLADAPAPRDGSNRATPGPRRRRRG
jgi:hypothetical protein